MREFLILFRFEMREQFALRESKRKFDLLGALVSFLISCLVIGVLGILLYTIAESYVQIKMNKVSDPIGRAYELLNLIYCIILIALSWINLVRMRKNLTNFVGREVFLRLPVRSGTVFLSKLLSLLLSNYLFAVPMIVVVNLIFYLVAPLSALFWLNTLLVVLLLPLIAFVLASLLLVPFIYIVDVVSKKYLATFLTLCTLLMLAFVLYAELLGVVQDMFLKGSIKFLFNAEFIGFLQKLATVTYPANLLASMALGENVLLCALISFGISAVGGVAVYFITNHLYRVTLYKNKPAPRAPKRKPRSSQHSPFFALLYKEFLMVYREPRHVFSFYAIAMAMPVMIYSCYTLFRTLLYNALGIYADFALALFVTLIFCILTNTFCATNISRDGIAALKNKLLPLTPAKLLLSKVVFCASISLLSLLLSVLILIFLQGFGVLDALVLFLLGASFSLSHILIATRMDLKRAVVSAPRAVMEKIANRTMAKTVLVGLAFSVLIGALSMFLLIFSGQQSAGVLGGLSIHTYQAYLFPAVIALLYLGFAVFYYNHKLKEGFDNLVA